MYISIRLTWISSCTPSQSLRRVEATAGAGGGTATAVPDGVGGIGLIGVGEKESP